MKLKFTENNFSKLDKILRSCATSLNVGLPRGYCAVSDEPRVNVHDESFLTVENTNVLLERIIQSALPTDDELIEDCLRSVNLAGISGDIEQYVLEIIASLNFEE
ncbi:MAG: hypothetical protein COA86_17925 [Kangiella sp.]|nr:MAG: hypothetical protein COA86_17925 [Kangiella sp.]